MLRNNEDIIHIKYFIVVPNRTSIQCTMFIYTKYRHAVLIASIQNKGVRTKYATRKEKQNTLHDFCLKTAKLYLQDLKKKKSNKKNPTMIRLRTTMSLPSYYTSQL
jgi:hypothetical protein